MTELLKIHALAQMPRSVVFGRGAAAAIGDVTAHHGQRVWVCCDPHIAAGDGLREITKSLQASNLAAAVFDEVEPDLPVSAVHKGVESAIAAKPDVLLAIGGGSSLDLAKLVALLLRHGGAVEDYYGENLVPGPVVPLVAVPTTAGTGSEVTPVAVVNDTRRNLKVGVSSRHLVPVACVCDPALTDTCPPTVTAHSGIDALAHAVEAFTAATRPATTLNPTCAPVFIGKNALSDLYALEAARRIAPNLRRAVTDPLDRAARDSMAYGSMLAGLAFASAGTCAAHAMQYPVGARTSTPHGLGVGLLLPYTMEFNSIVRKEEVRALGIAFGVVDPSAPVDLAVREAIDTVSALAADIGIPDSLRDLGVERSDLIEMAEEAATIRRLVDNNPRPLDRDNLHLLFSAAWLGDRAHLHSSTKMSV